MTVVVVTYNSGPLLEGLIASLPAGLRGLEWRLVVADNASSDDSVETVRRLAPDAVVVEVGHNGGYAAGINAGVAAARDDHDAILILNPDVRLGHECVRVLADALEEPGTGIAVPRLLDARGHLIDSMRREPTLTRALADALVGARRAGRRPWSGEVVTDPAAYQRRQYTDWAEGSTQLVSAECWAACGGWDESFFLYSEETDFDLRARDAGLRTVFVPEAEATHLEGGSSSTPDLWALLVANRVRLFRRRNGTAAAAVFWLLTLMRETSRAVLGRRTSRAAVRVLTRPALLRHPPGPEFLARVRSSPAQVVSAAA